MNIKYILQVAVIVILCSCTNDEVRKIENTSKRIVSEKNEMKYYANVLFQNRILKYDSIWQYDKNALPKISCINDGKIIKELLFNLPYEPKFMKKDSLFKSDDGNSYYYRINFFGKGILIPGQITIINNEYIILMQYDNLASNKLLKMSKFYLNNSTEEHYLFNGTITKNINDIDINYISKLKSDCIVKIERLIENNNMIIKKDEYLNNKHSDITYSFKMKSEFSLFWWINNPSLICEIDDEKLYYSAAIW